MGAIIIVDAFWGDSGKGKISALLTEKYDAPLCVRAGIGTNAGHSIYITDDQMLRTRQLPMGFVNPRTQLRVGPGVAVDPYIFFDELHRYNLEGRAKVDYRCPVITPEAVQAEKDDAHLASKINSTCSGSGRTLADFALRRAPQARHIPELKEYTTDVAQEVNEIAARGPVVIECSQGTFLSLALSPDYPYTTSGNCTAAAAMDDVGLNWQLVEKVVLVLKAIPSRVGAGPLPHEITREEILERGIAEYGVVTGRMRRKASQIDLDLLRYAVMLNGPTEIALTFCDHYDPDIVSATRPEQITPKVQGLIEQVEKICDVPVTIIETGKLYAHIIDRMA